MSTDNDSPIREQTATGQQGPNRRGSVFDAYQSSPVLQSPSSADENDLRAYQKSLRNYLVSGIPVSEPPASECIPVLAAPFLRGQHPPSDYPVFCSPDSEDTMTLQQLLEDVLEHQFDAAAPEELRELLPSLEDHMRDVHAQGEHTAFGDITRAALQLLREHDIPEEPAVVFDRQLKRYEGALLKRKGAVIDYSSLSAFRLLNMQVAVRRIGFEKFLQSLTQCIAGLGDLLMLHRKKVDKSAMEGHLDFAERMISLDKVAELTHSTSNAGLSKPTLKRVTECLETLEKGHSWLKEAQGRIFTTQAIAAEFSLNSVLTWGRLQIAKGRPCSELRGYAADALKQLVEIIKSLRIGTLEINQEYDEDLHTPYFAGFGLHHLTEEDLIHFPDLIVIEDSSQLLHQLEDFLAIIAGRAPLRVLAVNQLTAIGLEDTDDTESDPSYELAALAIANRKAFVYQGSAADPVMLGDAIRKGLQSTSPALWNILVSAPGRNSVPADYLALHAAVESRWFPQLTYDMATGEQFGSHFDIMGNTQPDQMFPSWSVETQEPSGKKVNDYAMTTADFLALDPERRTSLEIVPAKFVTDDLISLTEYLSTPQSSLIGKVPYIWMVDEKDELHRAAIPLRWLRQCRERLDYWRYIQELGGINNYHAQRALELFRAQWEAEKATEIRDLKQQLEETLDDVRKQEVEKAMKRVVLGLLDPGKAKAVSEVKPGQSPTSRPAVDESPQKQTSPQEEEVQSDNQVTEVEQEQQVQQVRPDAWVESALCTSCSDCIDALPAVFKYNGDKQAVVHNPKGGTYAKIVSLAEKCPARCIHPGLPQNPDEPGLDKLIKRAEKYN